MPEKTAWRRLAKPYDHHLSGDHPLWVTASELEFPAPLEMHLHRGIEIGMLMSGRLELHFGEFRLCLEAGQHWLVSMWEPHAWRVMMPGTRVVVVVFLPAMVEEILPTGFPWLELFATAPGRRPVDVPSDVRAEVKAIAGSLWQEIRARNPQREVMVGLDVARLLVAVHRSWRPTIHGNDISSTDPTGLTRLMPAITMANERLGSKAGPLEAAAACGLSPSRFHYLFKQALGMSFGRFRTRARLAYAAHTLLTTDVSIEAISERTGFVDASHFHRRFIRQYGCSPGDYRKAGRWLPDGGQGPKGLPGV